MTDARSWSSYVREAACPKCGAQPGDVCRTGKTNRQTDTHSARIDAWLLEQGRRRHSPVGGEL